MSHDPDFGNAILTRLEPMEVRQLDLSVPGREPRGALEVTLKAPDASALRVVNLHFGLQARERRSQLERLLAQASPACVPRIWLGDFNEWMPRGPVARELARQFAGAWLATFPAFRPVLALDRIWIAPPRLAASWSVDTWPLARVASDHLPVRADIQLRGGAEADPSSSRCAAATPELRAVSPSLQGTV